MSTPDAADRLPQALHWNHPEQLRRAWAELRTRPFEDAIARIRQDPRGGDHATLALAWARLVGAALSSAGDGPDFDSFARAHPQLLDPELVLRHYSPQRIASARARREFVLPDRMPLPAFAHPAKVRNRSHHRKDSEVAAAESSPTSSPGSGGSTPPQRT